MAEDICLNTNVMMFNMTLHCLNKIEMVSWTVRIFSFPDNPNRKVKEQLGDCTKTFSDGNFTLIYGFGDQKLLSSPKL